MSNYEIPEIFGDDVDKFMYIIKFMLLSIKPDTKDNIIKCYEKSLDAFVYKYLQQAIAKWENKEMTKEEVVSIMAECQADLIIFFQDCVDAIDELSVLLSMNYEDDKNKLFKDCCNKIKQYLKNLIEFARIDYINYINN